MNNGKHDLSRFVVGMASSLGAVSIQTLEYLTLWIKVVGGAMGLIVAALTIYSQIRAIRENRKGK